MARLEGAVARGFNRKVTTMGDTDFGFKKLRIWQDAVTLADLVIETTENLNSPAKHYRLIE